MPTTINLTGGWEAREQKALNHRGIRKALADSILSSSVPYRVLSFPAAHWLFEQNMASVFADSQFEFVGLECDPKVHPQHIETAKTLSSDGFFLASFPDPLNMREYAAEFDATKTPYDLVFLDWMGTWSKDKKEQLRTVFDNHMINDNGHLAITLMLWRGCGPSSAEISEAVMMCDILETDDEFLVDENTISEIAKCKIGSDKTFGVTQIIKALAEHAGQSASLVRMCIYKEPNSTGKKFTPQVSLLYQINKL